MSDNSQRMQRLLDKANSLPTAPGVYIMKDAAGKVIYVGKSRKLKNRVSQYFQNSEKSTKTARMVERVHEFEYILCETEIEALSLENTLIKQYTPKYNIRLKDAKSYPYIKLTDETYPRLVMTRKRDADKGKYFGPYSGVSTVYAVIGSLQKALQLPNCKRKFPEQIGKERPCLYYQIKQCCGVCTGKVTPEAYADKIHTAAEILRGNTASEKKRLTEQMFALAEQERYEAAAVCRDTIAALDRLSQKQSVVGAPDDEYDVFGLYDDGVSSALSVFFVRGGVCTDKQDYLFDKENITDRESLLSFICDLYRGRSDIPRLILISFSPDEDARQTAAEYLGGLAGRKVELRTPERGQLRALCETVTANAKEVAEKSATNESRREGVLLRLAHILELESYPARIEAYDISNFGKEHLTAGMIVTREGSFAKRDYRTFKIKSVQGTDDYASMREALSRRFAHLSDEEGSFAEYPDLILLDGGKGHVGVVRELAREMGLDIPIFGMVKDDFHKTRALCTEDAEISIAKESAVFQFIYGIQEEVHRYTVGSMKKAKTKTLVTSSLTQIPGIGPAKAAALLKMPGGLQAVKRASREELLAIKGIGEKDADAIIEYFKR